MKKLSVLVSSCDKYSHLLPYFTKLFDRYWEYGDFFEKYVYLENANVSYPGYKTIHTHETNWSNSLAKALTYLHTPYVFLFLDDFFLFRTITKVDVDRGLAILEDRTLDKYIYHYPHVVFDGKLIPTDLSSNIFRMEQDSEYTMTVQPSIWRVDYLKSRLNGENPWEFEISGSLRANEAGHNIYMEVGPAYHAEAMTRGQLTPQYYSIIAQEGL